MKSINHAKNLSLHLAIINCVGFDSSLSESDMYAINQKSTNNVFDNFFEQSRTKFPLVFCSYTGKINQK